MAPKRRGRAPSTAMGGRDAKRHCADPTMDRIDSIVGALQVTPELHEDYRNMLITMPKNMLRYHPEERERIQVESITHMEDALKQVTSNRAEVVEAITKQREAADEERIAQQETVDKLTMEMLSMRASADKLLGEREELHTKINETKERLTDLDQARHSAAKNVFNQQRQLGELEAFILKVKPICETVASSKQNDPKENATCGKEIHGLSAFGLDPKLLDAASIILTSNNKLGNFDAKVMAKLCTEMGTAVDKLKTQISESEKALNGEEVTKLEEDQKALYQEMNEAEQKLIELAQELKAVQDTLKVEKRTKSMLVMKATKLQRTEKAADDKLRRIQSAVVAFQELKDWRHLESNEGGEDEQEEQQKDAQEKGEQEIDEASAKDAAADASAAVAGQADAEEEEEVSVKIGDVD